MPPDAPLDTSARAERAAPVGFYLGKEDVLRTLTAAARTSRASYGATARLRQRIEALLDSDTVPHIEVGLVGRWAIRQEDLPVLAGLLGLPAPAIDPA